MSVAPHQQVIQNIQGTQSYSGVGRHNEPPSSLLASAGKRGHIAPLRDPRDAAKRKRTTNDDVAILAEQGLYVVAAETIRSEAAAGRATMGGAGQVANAAFAASKEQRQQNAVADAVSEKINSVARRVGSAPGDRPNSSAVYAAAASTGIPKLDTSAVNAAAHHYSIHQTHHHLQQQQQQQQQHQADDDDRNETLVSSGRQAVLKKRPVSAATKNKKVGSGIANVGSAQAAPPAGAGGRGPIVEALYTPSVEIEKKFLVNERVKESRKKLGCHLNEAAAFRSVPRPSPGDADAGAAAGGGGARAPAVGTYHPHYDAVDRKRPVFSFDSPTRTRSRHEKMNNNRNQRGGGSADSNQNQQQFDDITGHHHYRDHDEASLSQTAEFGFTMPAAAVTSNAFASATMRFAHAGRGSGNKHNVNNVSNNYNSSGAGCGGTMSNSFGLTATFKSTAAQDATLRFRGNVEPHNLRNKVQDGQNPNRDLDEMEQQMKDHEQNLQRGHKQFTEPEHQTFSTAGTSSFASKAPRLQPEPKDRLDYPDLPWPLMSPGAKNIRPTGGGAIGAPLGTSVLSPDVPQPHKVPSTASVVAMAMKNTKSSSSAGGGMVDPRRAGTPQPSPSVLLHHRLRATPDDPAGIIPPPPPGGYSMPRWHPNDAAYYISKSRTKSEMMAAADPTLQHPAVAAAKAGGGGGSGRRTPGIVARTRQTFLDGLQAPGYSERPVGDDKMLSTLHRVSVGVPFERGSGRYGHTTSTGAAIRFQPIRKLGRVVDPDVTSSAPVLVASEKFVEAGSINKLGHKDLDDVLSTKSRRVTPVSFEKQRNHRINEHEERHQREVVNPSSVLTSPIPLEHPSLSFVHSHALGVVPLQPAKRRSQYQSSVGKKGMLMDVWNTSPEDILASGSKKNNNGNESSFGAGAGAGYSAGRSIVDRKHDELSYARSASAIILPPTHHHHVQKRSASPATTSPQRFSFSSPQRADGNEKISNRHQTPLAAGNMNNTSSSGGGGLLHSSVLNNHSAAAAARSYNNNNSATVGVYRPIDEVRHIRSPTAFFPSTGHDDYVIHRSDLSRAENLAKKGVQEEPTPIPTERLLAAARSTQLRQMVAVDIGKTMSRDEREKRFEIKGAGERRSIFTGKMQKRL